MNHPPNYPCASDIIFALLTPGQIENKLNKILLRVQKPGRYVGGELNSIVKDWDSIQTKVAFVFPDIYDIGVSNVGLKILLDQVNQRDDALAERACSPWLDMEALMCEHGILRCTRSNQNAPWT